VILIAGLFASCGGDDDEKVYQFISETQLIVNVKPDGDNSVHIRMRGYQIDVGSSSLLERMEEERIKINDTITKVFNQKSIDDLKNGMDSIKEEIVDELNDVLNTKYVLNIFFDGILWP
jgi:flagellar basal body-associated protein FliL